MTLKSKLLKKVAQIILVAFSIILVFVLYFFGDITALKTDKANAPEGQGQVEPAPEMAGVVFDLDEYVDHIKMMNRSFPDSIYEAGKQEIESAETKPEEKKQLTRAVNRWDSLGYPVLAAHYQIRYTELEASEEAYLQCGDKANLAFRVIRGVNDSINQNFRAYFVSKAVDCYNKVLEIDPDNVNARIGLATSIVDGGHGMPMKGINLLREVVEEDSLNKMANYHLGRFAMRTSQFELAAKRFEIVVKQDSTNVDAMLQLGDAYQALGEKEKAKEIFIKCRDILKETNPAASEKLEKIINNIITT